MSGSWKPMFTLTLVVAAVAAVPARADLVTNPSFELPALPGASNICLNFFTPNCPAIPGWVGNMYIVRGTSSGTLVGPPPAPIPDGAQYTMLQGGNQIAQTISIPVAGTYTLTWFDAGRGAGSFGVGGDQSYEVRFGGTLLNTLSTTSGSAWSSHALSFTTGAGNFDLAFIGLATNDQSAFLDLVQIAAPEVTGVPEPATILLSLGGLAAVFARRKFTSRAAAPHE